MALNLFIDNDPNTTVNMSNSLDTYIITALDSTTYTYNLPAITTDGQTFTLVRTDNTTGIVNLVGNMNLNGSSIATYPIIIYSTCNLISLGGVWYIIYTNGISNVYSGYKNIFTAFYLQNSLNAALVFTSNAMFLEFPYMGLGLSVITITTRTTAISINSAATLYKSNGSVICSFPIPSFVNNIVYTLTPANKALLPTTPDYLYITNSGANSITISSVMFYA